MPPKTTTKRPPPTPGGPRTISMVDVRAFRAHVKDIAANEGRTKESATRFLIKLGYLTKSGELAPMYRSRKGE